MTSLVTNTSAIAATGQLRTIERDLNGAQSRISSGYRVEDSADNAAYWSIATTMGSDDRALGAVEDALDLASAQVDITYLGMTEAIEVMTEFRSKLVMAREPAADRGKINAELTELRAEIRTIAEGSSFNGENWLVTDLGASTLDRQIPTSFIRNIDGSVRVGTQTYGQTNGSLGNPNRLIDDSTGGMYGILTQPAAASGLDVSLPYYVFTFGKVADPDYEEIAVSNASTSEEIDLMIDVVDYMHQQMISAAANLGAIGANIDSQKEFLADLRDANKSGIGRLRDADITEDSSRLKALQVRQELGQQALNIANAKADRLMTLYQ
jgi:flagellin